jgi:hypothetical protein
VAALALLTLDAGGSPFRGFRDIYTMSDSELVPAVNRAEHIAHQAELAAAGASHENGSCEAELWGSPAHGVSPMRGLETPSANRNVEHRPKPLAPTASR